MGRDKNIMATKNSRFIYEIDSDTFAVTIYDNNLEHNHIPAIYQPHHPDANGSPWESEEDAKNWAEEFIAFHENPVHPLYPANEEEGTDTTPTQTTT
jgi:hypothetical protein